MKKILIILLLFLSLALQATNYYVDPAGSDAEAGTSPETAWATITRVNAAWASGTFAPADSILFLRGNIWYGTITISESGALGNPITIGAYGTGTDPIIEGFTTLSSWTSMGDSVYYASLSCESATEMVIVDGTQKAKGRWPNSGTWMSIETRPSTTRITDNELSASPDWEGAEAVIRENRWILTRHTITDHTSTSLTFTPAMTYNPTGYGYFIQNSYQVLDSAWEWFYDSFTSRLYVHTEGANPSSNVIRASSLNRGINNAGGYNYITVSDIEFRGFNTATIYSNYGNYDSHGFVVQNCIISYSGGDAIYINRSSADTVRNNVISYSNHAAVTLWGNYGNYCSITGNQISHTGEIPGAAFNLYGTTTANNAYNAIYSNPNYPTISGNRVTYTGYIPVNYRGINALIENNYINTYCYVKDDGAGVYVYDDESLGKRVLNNIILNGLGATEGMSAGSQISAHGIYTDGEAANVLFEGNIIGNMAKAAYHGNLPRNVTIINNLFFQCGQFLNLWKYYTDGVYINNLRITNNHFVTTAVNENLPALFFYQNSSNEYYTDIETEIAHIGIIDSNYYHVNTENLAYILLNPTGETGIAPYSLKRWIAEFGHDAHSQVTKLSTYTINSLGSNLISNGTFDTNITGWTGSSSAPISWDNTNALGTAGSLLLQTQVVDHMYLWWTNTYDIYTSLTSGVSNTSHYILRVNTKSDQDEKTIAFKTRNTGTGHEIQRFFSVPSVAAEKEVLLSFPETIASPATFKFASCDGQTNVWFDNIRFYEADVTIKDPDDFLHLLYNDTEMSKTYFLSAAMDDPEGTAHSGSVTLQPWTGMILIGDGNITAGEPQLLKGRTGVLLKGRTDVLLKPGY